MLWTIFREAANKFFRYFTNKFIPKHQLLASKPHLFAVIPWLFYLHYSEQEYLALTTATILLTPLQQQHTHLMLKSLTSFKISFALFNICTI